MFKIRFIVLSGVLLVSACGEKEVILSGDRLDHRAGITGELTGRENRESAIRLAPAVANEDWTHRGMSPSHAGGHPALGTNLSLQFVADIGEGNSRRTRISSDPVAAGGSVFTMDATGTVSAVSLAGDVLWQTDLSAGKPDQSATSGGGLAASAGMLFVSTGFGEVIALDQASGAVEWRQDLDAPAAGPPAIIGDRVLVVDRDSTAWSLDADTGRVSWSVDGTPSSANFGAGAGVAVDGRIAVLPFPSGEVVGAFPRGGLQRWSTVVGGQRLGSVAATISDIAGDPVIDGNRVYVANFSGRIAALDIETGDRIWTALHGAVGPIWPAGDSVFAVNDISQLVRLNVQSGQAVWAIDLPNGREKQDLGFLRRDRSLTAHYGPILAGGRIWTASSDGLLRAFDPVSGAMAESAELPSGAASAPIVVRGTLYVVTVDGELVAFR
ncbi:MAG: PQQ-binding-like beta-propeller repeat protein [Marivivens sp.]|nr:PQQ-binding-like beta-propeller repeat protein [Marivivens sp.]